MLDAHLGDQVYPAKAKADEEALLEGEGEISRLLSHSEAALQRRACIELIHTENKKKCVSFNDITNILTVKKAPGRTFQKMYVSS